MHAVLPGLRLRYPLEEGRGRIHVRRHKDRQGWLRVVHAVAKRLPPEPHQLLRVGTVKDHLERRVSAHALPPHGATFRNQGRPVQSSIWMLSGSRRTSTATPSASTMRGAG